MHIHFPTKRRIHRLNHPACCILAGLGIRAARLPEDSPAADNASSSTIQRQRAALDQSHHLATSTSHMPKAVSHRAASSRVASSTCI
eukprot:3377266-Pyramimonas_sp.AAC.3